MMAGTINPHYPPFKVWQQRREIRRNLPEFVERINAAMKIINEVFEDLVIVVQQATKTMVNFVEKYRMAKFVEKYRWELNVLRNYHKHLAQDPIVLQRWHPRVY